jgi:hypothetical protein
MPKKKAAPSDNTLWIGLGVAGAVALILIIAGAVGVYMYSHAGEPQAKGPLNLPPPPRIEPPPAPPEQPKFKDIGDKKRNTTSYRARVDRIERRNEMRQIGLFYQQYATEFNRPPARVEDLVDYIKRDAPGIVQAINEKYYFIVVGVRAGNGIVAYEFDPDQNGFHGFAEMGGRVDDLSSQQLVAQLKAQGSQ